MKKTFLIAGLLFTSFITNAQLTVPVPGGSVRGFVGERVGLTDVTINYGRPAVKGRDNIWGGLVQQGFFDNGRGNLTPWRAGANANTTIEFSTPVKIEGKHLPAGKYGFFVAYNPAEAVVILSKVSNSWGSDYYNESEDALRVKVKPKVLDHHTEMLSFDFSEQTDSSAVVSLIWEKLSISFKLETELHKLQLASMENELKTEKGYLYESWLQYAEYLNEKNVQLETALDYTRFAISTTPGFQAYILEAELLKKLGKASEAEKSVNSASKYGNAQQIHFYALNKIKKGEEVDKAIALFKKNYELYPDTYTTNTGMARAYSATGDYKKALMYANKALLKANDSATKANTEHILRSLKEGKNINL